MGVVAYWPQARGKGCGGKLLGTAEEAWERIKGAGATPKVKAWFALQRRWLS